MKITKAQLKQVIEEELKAVLEEDDRCTRIAKSKYKVWPSAYASGAVVRCRDGKIWKDLKEEELTDDEEEELEDVKKELEGASKMHKKQAKRIEKAIDEGKKNCGCGQDPCITFGIQEKKQSSEDAGDLHGWFARKGEKGSKGGWVDCKAPDGEGGYKECAQGDRKKKPYCRPTPSACKEEPQTESVSKQRLMEIINEELEEALYYEMLTEGETLEEAEYQGRKVTLNKPTKGDVKKSKVYVKNEKGNVVKVNFGDPNMKIKKNIPARRKSFRARHNCDNPGPKWKARYWSCKAW